MGNLLRVPRRKIPPVRTATCWEQQQRDTMDLTARKKAGCWRATVQAVRSPQTWHQTVGSTWFLHRDTAAKSRCETSQGEEVREFHSHTSGGRRKGLLCRVLYFPAAKPSKREPCAGGVSPSDGFDCTVGAPKPNGDLSTDHLARLHSRSVRSLRCRLFSTFCFRQHPALPPPEGLPLPPRIASTENIIARAAARFRYPRDRLQVKTHHSVDFLLRR